MIDFNDLDKVFGPAPETMNPATADVPNPPISQPDSLPVAGPSNPASAQRTRGRGRGSRAVPNANILPGQGGYLARGGGPRGRGGYHHIDVDIQQYSSNSQQVNPQTFYPDFDGRGRSQGRGRPGFQPPQLGRGGRGRGLGHNDFGGHAYQNDINDATGQALRRLVRGNGIDPNNIYLKPIKFAKSKVVLFEDQEEIFAPEVADNGEINEIATL